MEYGICTPSRLRLAGSSGAVSVSLPGHRVTVARVSMSDAGARFAGRCATPPKTHPCQHVSSQLQRTFLPMIAVACGWPIPTTNIAPRAYYSHLHSPPTAKTLENISCIALAHVFSCSSRRIDIFASGTRLSERATNCTTEPSRSSIHIHLCSICLTHGQLRRPQCVS